MRLKIAVFKLIIAFLSSDDVESNDWKVILFYFFHLLTNHLMLDQKNDKRMMVKGLQILFFMLFSGAYLGSYPLPRGKKLEKLSHSKTSDISNSTFRSRTLHTQSQNVVVDCYCKPLESIGKLQVFQIR